MILVARDMRFYDVIASHIMNFRSLLMPWMYFLLFVYFCRFLELEWEGGGEGNKISHLVGITDHFNFLIKCFKLGDCSFLDPHIVRNLSLSLKWCVKYAGTF